MDASAAPPAPELPCGLAEWMSRQRWYGSKGSVPRLERVGGWAVGDASLRIETHYVLDRQRDSATLYQVPLTRRAIPLTDREPILITDDGAIYDAPHDLAYAALILELILTEDVILAEGTANGVRGHRQPGARPNRVTAAAVLTGEQSNTSIICSVETGDPVILKVFRALHHGDNPDVVLQSAIAATGSLLVPTSIGSVSGEWPDSAQPGGVARGHVAFAQQFLVGAEDAWRIALRAAAAGADFSVSARELGNATAAVHATLAEVLPTRQTGPNEIHEILAGMRSRMEWAIREVPSLDELRPLMADVIERARGARWPRLQRIHGDYHLGQVLAVPGRGWVLVDFEGEPLRDMVERSQPDVTLRDVAGMLRSFDYAAGSVAEEGTWASRARTAFLAGYAESTGGDLAMDSNLIDAFELDKALYEAVYEARNRPDWTHIPVAAIRKLATRSRETRADE